MKRRLPALLTAVLMTLTLGACSSGKPPGTEEVRIGYFPNITHAQALVGKADGTFAAVASPEEIPGCRWFFETGEYGGLEYWMPVSYLAKRGVRMIQPIAE